MFNVKRKCASHELLFWRLKENIKWTAIKSCQSFVSENVITVSISLHGGMVNMYREFALSKALFEGRLKFMDVYQKYDFEIDEKLLKIR